MAESSDPPAADDPIRVYERVIAEQRDELDRQRDAIEELEAALADRDQALERVRVEQRQQIDAMDRARNEFINVVSHELRTPMTSILGYAEFLEEELDLRDERGLQRHVGQILAGTRRLERLVNDLLDQARLDAGTFRLDLEIADLRVKIHEAVESLVPQAVDKALEILLDLPSDEIELRMDGGRIEQALFNLLVNAIKFTPSRGRISVSARCAGGLAHVEVRDSGPGFAPEGAEALFGKFVQGAAGAAHPRSGLGLGLSIAKAIIEAHGGDIGLDSEPGVGSRFWFTLPLSAGAEIKPALR